MAEGLTSREQYLRRIESLALSVLPIQDGLLAAAPSHHDGAMVALVPSNPESLAVEHDEALPVDDLHITLCFLGKAADLSTFDKTRILSETRRVCDAVGHAFSASADGVVVMGSNDDGVPATALLVQSDDIVSLYDALSEALDYKSDYPSFIPHATIGYGVPVEDAEKKVGQQIDFNTVIVKFGDAIHTIPLAAALTAAPRGANVIDRVIDSLGRLWDEALHPRDAEGKFIKKNGAVSGKLAVPTRDRKGVNMVDANRASVIGFRTFDNDVWVLAEITNPDGSKTQGFARASNVQAVAPVKARLDALYPIDDHGDAFIDSSLERKRQLDLILAYMNSRYTKRGKSVHAKPFLEGLGLTEQDLAYIHSGDDKSYLGGIRKVERELSDDELEEVTDIIEDARQVKSLRERVHGIQKSTEDTGISEELFEAASRLAGGLDSNFDSYDQMIDARSEILSKGVDRVSELLGLNVYGSRKRATRDAVVLTKELPSMPTSERTLYRGSKGSDSDFPVGSIVDWPFNTASWDESIAKEYASGFKQYDQSTDKIVFEILPGTHYIDGSDIDTASAFNTSKEAVFGGRFEVVEHQSDGLDETTHIVLRPIDDSQPHTQPKQDVVTGDVPDLEVVDAIKSGADPLTLSTNNLLGALIESGRFERIVPVGATGVSPIEWHVDHNDSTGVSVKLAGVPEKTTDRAYFVKQSVIGAEFGNTDIVNEVTASLIAEHVAESVGADDSRLLKVPKSVFGDNPEWDEQNPPGSGDPFDDTKTHQPGHIVSQHAGYLIPSDWSVTDVASEETAFRNDIRGLDPAAQRDQTEAFYEDIGEIYGNEIAKMILWDYVLLNGDRNPGNALLAVSPDGTQSAVLPIDHGFAFDEPFVKGDNERSFDWFMQYQFTLAWRNYVLGGLRLNNNVTEDTLRQTIKDFIDVYGNISLEEILNRFRAMPGVTDEQIERVKESMDGAVDRIAWIRDNMEAVLRALSGESDALM